MSSPKASSPNLIQGELLSYKEDGRRTYAVLSTSDGRVSIPVSNRAFEVGSVVTLSLDGRHRVGTNERAVRNTPRALTFTGLDWALSKVSEEELTSREDLSARVFKNRARKWKERGVRLGKDFASKASREALREQLNASSFRTNEVLRHNAKELDLSKTQHLEGRYLYSARDKDGKRYAVIRLDNGNEINVLTSSEALRRGASVRAAPGRSDARGNIYWRVRSVAGRESSRQPPLRLRVAKPLANVRTFGEVVGKTKGSDGQTYTVVRGRDGQIRAFNLEGPGAVPGQLVSIRGVQEGLRTRWKSSPVKTLTFSKPIAQTPNRDTRARGKFLGFTQVERKIFAAVETEHSVILSRPDIGASRRGQMVRLEARVVNGKREWRREGRARDEREGSER